MQKLFILFVLLLSITACAPVHSIRPANDNVLQDKPNKLMWARKVNAESINMDGKLIKINDSLDEYGRNFYTYDQAGQFITMLNQISYAGYEDWRLPTTDELKKLTDLSIAKINQTQQLARDNKQQQKTHTSIGNGLNEIGYLISRPCWTSNPASDDKVWIVPMGHVDRFYQNESSRDSRNSVCPVRSISSSEE